MTLSHYSIEMLTREQVEPVKCQITSIYRDAFSTPPYNRTEIDVDSFSRTWDWHIERRHFRCAIAIEEVSKKIVGFAYGYTSEAGQWWHDLVEGRMDSVTARQWLTDTFELVELAVAPPAQGQGAGGQLHDILLTGLSHRSAVLSTMQSETIALKLYRKRGWVTLLEEFYFPGSARPYLIMGLDLAKRDPAWRRER